MTAPTKGGIDVPTAILWLKRCYGFGEKNGSMEKIGGHNPGIESASASRGPSVPKRCCSRSHASLSQISTRL